MDARKSSDACRFLSGQLGREIQTWELASTLHCHSLPCFPGQPQTRVVTEVTGDKHFSSFRICFDSPSCGFHSTNANFDQVVNTCPSLPCPGSHLFVGRLNICENSWTVCHLETSFSPRVLLRKAFSSLESQLLLPPPLSFLLVLSSAALLVSSRLTAIQPQVPRLLLMFEESAWVWLGFTGVWWLFGVRFRGISANTVVCFPHHFYYLHLLTYNKNSERIPKLDGSLLIKILCHSV